MDKETFVKIVETVESGEPEPTIPEWIRNPGIQITVIRRWRIISHDGRTLIRKIIIDHRGFIILRIILRWCLFSIRLFNSCILILNLCFNR
jgi:hypothetical protein